MMKVFFLNLVKYRDIYLPRIFYQAQSFPKESLILDSV